MRYAWHGKNADGIPIITGSCAAPSLYWSLVLIGVGLFMTVQWTIGFIEQWFRYPGNYLSMIALVPGPLLCALGYGLLVLRRRILKLSRADAVCDRLGIEAQALQEFAEERGIKPRYNINGQDFYDLKDFGEAATLLRASAPSESLSGELLRPSEENHPTPPEQLLRTVAIQPGEHHI